MNQPTSTPDAEAEADADPDVEAARTASQPAPPAAGYEFDTERVDVRERIADLDEAIEDLEAETAAIREEASALQAAGEAESERYADLAADYPSLAEDLAEAEQARARAQAAIDEWGGAEFTIKEFAWGDQARVNDLVRHDQITDSDQLDHRAKLSALKVRTVQVGVTQSPPDAPASPVQYPPVIGEFLYQKLNALNRFGEVELHDFSLEAALQDGSDSNS